MNLRQKAKKYKQLAELYGSKTIQPQIIYNTENVKIYKTSKLVPKDALEYPRFKSMVEKDVFCVMIDDLMSVANFEWITDKSKYYNAKCTCTIKVVGENK